MALTDAEIRPPEYNEGKERALQKDLDWLRAKISGFVDVDCPACDGEHREHEFEKFGFSFVRCLNCATVYMSPRASAATLAEFYATSELYKFWNEFIFPSSDAVRREKIFIPRIRRVLEICQRFDVPRELLIEVGAGHGIFCDELRKRKEFRRVLAIEPATALAAHCRSLGIETIESVIENITLDSAADVIVSFEVLEHLFSPREFLLQCATLQDVGGLLVLTCPNYQGFDIQTLGDASDSLDAEHINLFNPWSLPQLVRTCGYEVLECTTPGELDADIVRQKVLRGELVLTRYPFLHKVLIDDWHDLGNSFQRFLRENRMSSHMWLAARRAAVDPKLS
ncbi:MAG: class I SAM-dependent methyltransferase [Bdellovibrionales bacterium]|nr:class I SAM-dependent methyltransferase [Bdellovibrionales bacterium]